LAPEGGQPEWQAGLLSRVRQRTIGPLRRAARLDVVQALAWE
jgi:hypothetical protein